MPCFMVLTCSRSASTFSCTVLSTRHAPPTRLPAHETKNPSGNIMRPLAADWWDALYPYYVPIQRNYPYDVPIHITYLSILCTYLYYVPIQTMYLSILRTYPYYVLIHTTPYLSILGTYPYYVPILRTYLFILRTYPYYVPIHTTYLCDGCCLWWWIRTRRQS